MAAEQSGGVGEVDETLNTSLWKPQASQVTPGLVRAA